MAAGCQTIRKNPTAAEAIDAIRKMKAPEDDEAPKDEAA